MIATGQASTSRTKAVNLGRWLILLPASAAGAWLAYVVMVLINKVPVLAYAELGPFAQKALQEITGNIALGIAFVYIGIRVAPSCKRLVAYVMAGLSIIFGCVMLYYAVTAPSIDPWAVVGGILFLASALLTAYSALTQGSIIQKAPSS